MACIFRDATPADFERTHALYEQIHRLHVRGRPDIYRDADPLPRAKFDALLADRDGICLVAELDGVVAGCCQLTLRGPSESPMLQAHRTAFVEALVVDEGSRGHGVGAGLFRAARTRAKERGADRLSLNVWCFNADALAFYRRMGLLEQCVRMEESL